MNYFGRGGSRTAPAVSAPGMGADYRVKVPSDEGSSSRQLKARVSVARRNLKEAGGKPPVRGTRTPSEANGSWMSLLNKAKSLLPRAAGSKWGGWMEGKSAFLPGETCRERPAAMRDNLRYEARLNRQESAEAIVLERRKGRTWSR